MSERTIWAQGQPVGKKSFEAGTVRKIEVDGRWIEVENLEGPVVLKETDLYKSTSGEWQRCPCPGCTLQPGTDVEWVRPIEKPAAA